MFALIAVVVTVVLLAGLLYASNAVRYIPNNKIGVVEKLWSAKGSIPSGFIALNGEAGYQPDCLRGGFHFFFPFQYRVHPCNLVTISQGRIGYVIARDGIGLAPSQTLASNATARDFQDARSFFAHGGQKGPQRLILREGVYAINLAQFAIATSEGVYSLGLSKEESNIMDQTMGRIQERHGFEPIVIKDSDDQLGVVTIHDGSSLPQGELIAPTVGADRADADRYHNNFQDPEHFLAAGGFRGRQHQVLVEGTYYLNRLFATVDLRPKTIIDVGSVGVVISYIGGKGADVSGEAYTHGELVPVGCRGVWSEPLLPGKYAFNPYAGKIVPVPTVNFILKWSKEVTNAHKLDENLSEVSLITKDAFEPSLPLSVVVHIDYKKAPLVIQRFGDIKKLVEQTLDPMVSAYFKNIGQTKTLIELLQDRSAIQDRASQEMRAKFDTYSLQLLEVLIGTPHAGDGAGATAIDKILAQLRDRQVAREQIETYKLQGEAAGQERELKESQSRAQMQTRMTEAELSIQVSTSEGTAKVAMAEKDADVVRAAARAAGDRVKIEGEAEATKVKAVGEAQADATRKQVEAYTGEGARIQSGVKVLTEFANAIREGKVAMVPQVMLGGSGSGSEGALSQTLSTLLLSNQLGLNLCADAKPPVTEKSAG
jgi:uncharacterized membrane protein YqiK